MLSDHTKKEYNNIISISLTQSLHFEKGKPEKFSTECDWNANLCDAGGRVLQ